ncbi:protein-tyrosine phosphatase-like protein [Chlamydoabsidia padenii]|nr:protein-tyrosine phosphatase-like protein [Chlamydoabsidia padenii]
MGNLALSSCPGKKVRLSGPVRGRAAINRDLDLDFTRMRSFGITTLVCCLEDTELEYLGASWSLYEASAHQNGLQVLRLPMIEGSCPSTLEEIDKVITIVNDKIWKRGENVLTHCRGGVGRAGLFACCWLINNTLCLSAERAIRFVRVRRSPKAIETMRQAEYVIRYAQFVMKQKQQGGGDGSMGAPLVLAHTDLTLSVPSVLDIGQLEEALREY